MYDAWCDMCGVVCEVCDISLRGCAHTHVMQVHGLHDSMVCLCVLCTLCYVMLLCTLGAAQRSSEPLPSPPSVSQLRIHPCLLPSPSLDCPSLPHPHQQWLVWGPEWEAGGGALPPATVGSLTTAAALSQPVAGAGQLLGRVDLPKPGVWG